MSHISDKLQNDKIHFDDVTHDFEGDWTQVCDDHIDWCAGLGRCDEIGNGICGVAGCQEESTWYIDLDPKYVDDWDEV